jgi:hypothetical protein
MESKNELALQIAYFLSKHDRRAFELLGFDSWNQAYREIGTRLNVKPNSVKNMRDEFDSVHPNPRSGWHQRELRPSRKRVVDQIGNMSEEELLNHSQKILASNQHSLGKRDSSIPDEITREQILAAITNFNQGVDHRFGHSTTYDLLHEGERYPPKAIVGLAAAYILGKPLQPEDFGGGLETKCFRLLESNGFKIVRKTDNAEPPMTREQATDRLANIVGDSSGKAEVNTRKEQKILQDYLIQSRTEAICHLCGKEFPVTFLVAAHIKKRAGCTNAERKILDVAMLACKFGCDELYEKKYIFVDEQGVIRRNQSKSITKAMEPTIVRLDGKKCDIWSSANKAFFDAHRASDQ